MRAVFSRSIPAGPLKCVLLLCALGLVNTPSAALDIEDFAGLPRFSDLAISTQGTYYSAFIGLNDGSMALLVEAFGSPKEPYIVGGGDWHLRWSRWIDDHRLLVGISVPRAIFGTPVQVTRLILVDAKQEKMKMLFRRETGEGFFQIQDDFVGTVNGKPDHILVAGHTENTTLTNVYLASLKRSNLPKRTYQRAISGVQSWQADNTGEIRVGYGFSRDQEERVFMLRDENGEWHDYGTRLSASCRVEALPSHQPDRVYMGCPLNDGFTEVREFFVASGNFGELIAGAADSDVSRVIMSADGTRVDAVTFSSETQPADYRHPLLQQIKALADKSFPDTTHFLASWTDDYKKILVGAFSDSLPLHYYLFDYDKKSLNYLTTSRPELMEKAPGRVHTVQFTARDGLEIPGYLTLPKALTPETASRLPFIVHPHGGPHARDFNNFDWMTQMFTHAGYGVLQINFRGSTGYGEAFEQAGRRQWGQAMQDDITDGTRWLVEQGFADAKRICIFGGSYGGYAALMGAAKEPDLYQCAASLNGVTDLRALLRSQRRYIGGEYYTRHIGRLWKDRRMLEENSPTELADNIRIPIFLAHGKDDRVVPVRQSRMMRKALDEQVWQYLELPDGDHYLSREPNRLLFAHTLMDFFETHLEP